MRIESDQTGATVAGHVTCGASLSPRATACPVTMLTGVTVLQERQYEHARRTAQASARILAKRDPCAAHLSLRGTTHGACSAISVTAAFKSAERSAGVSSTADERREGGAAYAAADCWVPVSHKT